MEERGGGRGYATVSGRESARQWKWNRESWGVMWEESREKAHGGRVTMEGSRSGKRSESIEMSEKEENRETKKPRPRTSCA